jgi:uncharacterized protein
MRHVLLRNVVLGLALAWLVPASAQQPPTAAAIATAKEILVAKGAAAMWEPVVPGVVSRVRDSVLQNNVLTVQSNAAFGKDLNEIAKALVTEFAAKGAELTTEVARAYAEHFTEAELKELLAFYKSPLGKKAISEEPKVIDESAGRINKWAEGFTQTVIARMRTEMKKKGYDI